MKALLLATLLLPSCVGYHDMYGNSYASAGGDADVTFPGGGHLTHSHTASFQHFIQGITATAGSLAIASVTKAKNASDATTTQQSNAQASALASQKEADAAAAAKTTASQGEFNTAVGAGAVPTVGTVPAIQP